MNRTHAFHARTGWGLAALLSIAGAAHCAPPGGGSRAPSRPPTGAGAEEHFETHVRPLLLSACVRCHGPQTQMGGLRLDSREAALKGGGRGPAAVPGDVRSLLLRVVLHETGVPKMPPDRKLPSRQVEALRAWVKTGVVWPAAGATAVPSPDQHWAFRPIRRPTPPKTARAAWVKSPLDAFVLAGLESRRMEPAPPCGPREWLRRVTFDLHGLPPTPDDVATFLADGKPGARERVVDRLLASPRYGERWGRHWLDTVRYADTSGYERDADKPFAWKYRDYVIRSLNQDKPYDRFILEQLAGDELPGRNEETVIATGFLRVGTWDDEPNDPLEYQYERLDDLVHATSSAFLGLTLRCARCHDHKYDPLPQKDYYAIGAAFWNGYLEAGDRKLNGGPPQEKLGFPVLGFTDAGASAPPLRLLKNGDPRRQDVVVPPGYLSIFPALARTVQPPAPGASTTQLRRQLAEWIIDPANPLTARVIVNRVWTQRFGQGLVRTPNNLGVKGDRPSHPELLDWLSSWFATDGRWRLKSLHRLMVLSNTYAMDSRHPKEAEYAGLDAGNYRLWKANRRRLDADALRDALLAVSGRLNLKEGGPGFVPDVDRQALEGLSRKGAEWMPSPPEEQNRRSVYLFLKRALIPPFLTVFDFHDTTEPVEQRDSSIVAPQALTLMNNSFVHEQSLSLAERVQSGANGSLRAQVDAAWRLAFGRPASPAELRRGEDAVLRWEAQTNDRPETGLTPPTAGLTLRLSAGTGVVRNPDGTVRLWEGTGGGAAAAAVQPGAGPAWEMKAINGRPALRFDGKGNWLRVPSPLVTGGAFTFFVVATDRAEHPGHRGLLSNWNGAAGNIGSALFLGTTGGGQVRVSDHFISPAPIVPRGAPFVLGAVADRSDAAMVVNGRWVLRRGGPLPPRNLMTPWVIGQQGNINGEYWKGDIAEVWVYDRALSEPEVTGVSEWLARRYGILRQHTPRTQALASLCHVLFNSNEFLFVD